MPILTTTPTGARSRELPTRRRMLLADDATYERFRRLAIASGLTNNLTLAALLDCYEAHGGPIRVEGAGLRVLCGQNAPCAPDCPSAGPVQVRHAKPTRRCTDDMSAEELRRRIASARAEERLTRAQGARFRAAFLEAVSELD